MQKKLSEKTIRMKKRQALKFNGVYFDRSSLKFKTKVLVNGTMLYAGYHRNAVDAAKAINEELILSLGRKEAMSSPKWNVID